MALNLQQKGSLNIDFFRIKQTLVNFIVPLICLIVSGLLGFFVIVPATHNLPEMSIDLEGKKALDSQLKDKKAKLNDILDFKNVISENASLVDEVLVSESLVPELLTQINQIARESGFEVVSLTYSYGGRAASSVDKEEVSADMYETVAVSLGARGNYDQLVTFLLSCENAARFITVDTFRYGIDSREPSVLEMTFSLSSPYLFVQSSAVTDDPVLLDVTDEAFVEIINRIKSLRFYEISVDTEFVDLASEESAEESEEGEEGEGPAEGVEESGEVVEEVSEEPPEVVLEESL